MLRTRELAISLLIVVTAASHGAATPAEEVPCDGDFHVVEKFTRGRRTAASGLEVAGSDLWILQSFTDKEHSHRMLLKKWDGSSWTTIPVPEPEEGSYYFVALDVADDGSAWLAGTQSDIPRERAVVLRWDGRDWEETRMPEFPLTSFVFDLDMLSANEGWAVGEYEINESRRALAVRWNGVAWEQMETPLEGYASLEAVSAAASNDVWTVGDAINPLTLHWDGATWTKYRLPRSKERSLGTYEVETVSPTEAWIVGTWERRRYRSAIVAWDGSRWSNVAVKNFKGQDWLIDVDVGSSKWIVGEARTRDATFPAALRREDGDWVEIGSDNPGRGGHFTNVVGTDDGAWATGRASSRKLGLYGVLQRACVAG
jgi:hypothetical protein